MEKPAPRNLSSDEAALCAVLAKVLRRLAKEQPGIVVLRQPKGRL